MQLDEYLKMMRRRWVSIAAVLVACLTVAVLYIVTTQPTYSAHAQVFVAPSGESSTTELATGSDFYRDRVKTYAYIVDSDIVLQPVVEQLELSETPRELARRVSATAPIDTVLLSIRVEDHDPARAAQIANAIADQFKQVAVELETPDATDNSVVRVTVVQRAVTPSVPVAPQRKLILGLAIMVGLALGVAQSIIREALNRRIRTDEELRSVTDLPVLGKIPQATPATDGAPRVRPAEAFRQLRTNLEFLKIDNDIRSLVITSPSSGEGKTATSINLALSAAEAGMAVCLVDADLRRPRVGAVLGIEDQAGLTSIIIDAASIDQSIQRWGEYDLDVLPAGQIPPSPSVMLSSAAMADLVAELERRYDLVIFDSPPVLAVADASIVGQHTSGTLLVVAGGRRAVTREQLSHTISTLRTAGTRVLGIIRNRLDVRSGEAPPYESYESAERPIRPRTPLSGKSGPATDIASETHLG